MRKVKVATCEKPVVQHAMSSIGNDQDVCPLKCGLRVRTIDIPSRPISLIDCPNCGMFGVTSDAMDLLRDLPGDTELRLPLLRRFLARCAGELTIITDSNFIELAAEEERFEGSGESARDQAVKENESR
jgi:hypothetical protein